MNAEAIIWTEGKTDWQHLKHAFQALDIGSKLAFEESCGDLGDDQLLKQCAALARVAQSLPNIFIFDRDNDEMIRKVEDSHARLPSAQSVISSIIWKRCSPFPGPSTYR